jgi:two-component system, NtrC family, sensor kinase
MKHLFTFVLALTVLFAQGQIIVADSVRTTQQFCHQVGVFKLPSNADLSNPNGFGPFEYFPVQAHNLGLSKDTYLLQLVLTGQGQKEQPYVLELLQPGMDHIVFMQKKEGAWISTKINDNTKIVDRFIKSQNPSIELHLQKDRIDTVYMAVASGEQILTPFRLGPQGKIEEITHTKDTIYGVFCGIMLALILYNFFIFVRTKDAIYGLYILYLGIIFLAQSNIQGYTICYFNGFFAPIERYLVHILMAFSGITGIMFISRYLEVKRYAPKSRWMLNATIVLYALSIPITLTQHFNLSHQLLLVIGSIIGPSILYLSYYCYKRGNNGALSLLIAWSVFFIGVMIFAFKDFGILPYNDWTHNTMTIGSAIEGILLSFGLADKINTLKKEKEEAQSRELESLKLSETKLEEQVRERTHQLQEAKEQIEIQYHDLQKSQRQLIESEKMAGLGQMTAGIAHELNNPINFVSSNVEPLARDIEEILDVLNDFKELPEAPSPADLEAIRQKFKEYDVPLLESEIKSLLHGIKEGSTRASDIVSGLRIFARTDQEVFVNANLNDCVNATLVLIKSTWKNEVALSRQLDDALPNIECLPGKLNQVIVNLITNAVQASIEHHSERHKRMIHVTTYHDPQYIYLRVTDNGPGIPEAIIDKIFEPFFTTKKVGQGTGLGLSISKSIIEDHLGELEIQSTVGEGTEFLVRLPRNKERMAQAA